MQLEPMTGGSCFRHRILPALPALRARAVLRGVVPVLLVPSGALRNRQVASLLRGTAHARSGSITRPVFASVSVYVGGGTPTANADELLETPRTRQVACRPSVHVDRDEPQSISTPRSLERYRAAGVDAAVGRRAELRRRPAGRHGPLEKYGSGELIRSTHCGRAGPFPTLNVDMIFNLPGQTLAMLNRDLSFLRKLRVDQISFYPLMTAPTARLHDGAHGRVTATCAAPARCTIAILDGLAVNTTRHRRHGASPRNKGMFDEYIIDGRRLSSGSAAARSVTSAARCIRRLSR